MVTLMQLWGPIVLSAVLVFFASSLIHMVFQWHKSEYLRLPNEDEVRAAIRRQAPPPGKYVLPYCTGGKEMQDPAMVQKFVDGPVGFLLLKANGMQSLGRMLGSWFTFSLVAAFAVAYVASRTMAPGADYLQVFRVVGTITFLTYTGGSVIDGIWMGKPWRSVMIDALDGLIYGCLSGGAFGWLWPR